MKIICKKCHEDISKQIDSAYEAYTPCQISCSKCKHKEERYISEADILLYFAISEVFYVVISLATNALITYQGFTWPIIALLFAILAAYFVLQKQMGRYLYLKAPFKASWKNHVFDEDTLAISKSIKWQIMLFFAIAIYFMMGEEANAFFGFLMVLSVLLTFIKFYLAIKKEKKIIDRVGETK